MLLKISSPKQEWACISGRWAHWECHLHRRRRRPTWKARVQEWGELPACLPDARSTKCRADRALGWFPQRLLSGNGLRAPFWMWNLRKRPLQNVLNTVRWKWKIMQHWKTISKEDKNSIITKMTHHIENVSKSSFWFRKKLFPNFSVTIKIHELASFWSLYQD